MKTATWFEWSWNAHWRLQFIWNKCLIDWFSDGLRDCLLDWMTGWLVGWMIVNNLNKKQLISHKCHLVDLLKDLLKVSVLWFFAHWFCTELQCLFGDDVCNLVHCHLRHSIWEGRAAQGPWLCRVWTFFDMFPTLLNRNPQLRSSHFGSSSPQPLQDSKKKASSHSAQPWLKCFLCPGTYHLLWGVSRTHWWAPQDLRNHDTTWETLVKHLFWNSMSCVPRIEKIT